MNNDGRLYANRVNRNARDFSFGLGSHLVSELLSQGLYFLGYITFKDHRVIRTVTKTRMLKKLSFKLDDYLGGRIDLYSMNQTLQSYLGILSHADSYKLQRQIKN